MKKAGSFATPGLPYRHPDPILPDRQLAQGERTLAHGSTFCNRRDPRHGGHVLHGMRIVDRLLLLAEVLVWVEHSAR
jgi:hypothetical protein